MKASINCIHLIEKAEGFSPVVYLDAAGLPTIGYGTLIDTPQEQYLKNTIVSRIEAEELLREELDHIEKQLAKMIRVPLSQNQYDSLASFAYNLGTQALKRSTLLKKINQNPDDISIQFEFRKWVHADGRKLAGLVTRRADEAALYMNKNQI